MADPNRLRDWIEALPESGRYVFTRAEAERVSGASDSAVRMVLHRLKRSGAVVSPRRGFHVVVPREYRAAGSPPASWFVDALMRHLDRRYYVALLSAAALHGAGHQQPIAMQVIADAPERDVEVGRVRIEFHVSLRMDGAAAQRMPTDTGSMLVSTPATTACDLVRFPGASGGWSNVATVLVELGEQIDPVELVDGSRRLARRDVQRLGWMCDHLGLGVLADALDRALAGQQRSPTPLTSSLTAEEIAPDPRWRVVVNDDVEPDL